MNAPEPPDEARRLAALHELDVLDTPPEDGFDALAAAAARLTGCPIALISLVDEDRLWFKAHVGLDAQGAERDLAFCSHAILGSGLFEVGDLAADARFRDNPLVTGAPRMRFYAGQPLRVSEQSVGTLCVIDHAPRRLGDAERELLAELGRAASELLSSRRHLIEARRQRTRLLDFARAAGDWMWESDAEHRYSWLSGPFEPLTGLAADQLLGQPIADTPLLDEHGGPRADRLGFRALLDRRLPFARAITAGPAPRGLLQVSYSAVPCFDAAGGFAGYRGTARDVSSTLATAAALREHEQRWQLAAGAAGLGIAQLTLADGRVHLDARACANHGLPFPQPAFTLADWAAQIDPADRAAATGGVEQAIASGTPFEGRYRIHRPDGTLRWLEFVVRATYGDDGRCSGVVGTCRDVHEQQTAAELRRQKDEAERASRAKTEFLSRVSHELRTPLNAILGFTQLMSLDDAQPLLGEQGRRLANVRQASRHLLGLIDDVLELTRIERADFALQTGPVDLGAALAGSLTLLQPLAGERGIALHRTADGGAGPWARGDARAIEQVLINLLANAIKFSPPGATVAVELRHEGGRVALAVRDHGVGLSAAQQTRLFQPFERLGADPQTEGSGLGLVIARELVEAMGGRIEVDSAPGLGSTFTVRLPPAEPAHAEAPAAAAPPSEPDAGGSGAGTPRRVLYIEDEPLNQLLLQELFRSRPGWRLEVAADGAGGLRQLAEAPPDLLLIDMNLPDTTGIELIRRLRADPALRALRCVALSADALAEQVQAARAAGFDDYWTKPIDLLQVLGKLDALLA